MKEKEPFTYADLRASALLTLAFHCHPHLFDEFKRTGKVPRPFTVDDTEILDGIRSTVERIQEGGEKIGVVGGRSYQDRH